MKKVLVSAYACIPGRGSEEGNGWHYASIISDHNYQVWCLTRSVGKANIEHQLEQKPRPNLTFVYVDVPNWIERAFNWGLIGMYFHYLYWQWAAFKKARQLNEKHVFDVVHHVSYGSLQLGSFLYKLNRPFVFGPIGGGQEAPAQLRGYFRKYWYKEQMRSWVSKLLLYANPGCYEAVRKAKHVLVWNEDTRSMVRALGRTDAVTKEFSGVPRTFIPDEPLVRKAGSTLELVWVGRLLPRKALELTLHGFSKVDRQLPIHLTVVGDGEMGQYVQEYLDKYDLNERVTWTGKVSYDKVKEYYRNADVFVFTSLRDTGPTQLVEAMAYSLPVVTLNMHGQAELVNNTTGIRVPITDGETIATDFAEAIEWMYYHPEQRMEMGKNAYQFASQQVWELKIGRLIKSYYGMAEESLNV